MAGLTPKQQEIYDYILSYTRDLGYPPSVREICRAVALKSPSSVHFHLKALEGAGYLTRSPGKTRALHLSGPGSTPASSGEDPRIPLVGHVAAGQPILAQECIEDYVSFDVGRHLAQEHFALRVRGESMLGAGILPGDVIVVHSQPTAQKGDIVVALLEDEATVKTFSPQNGHVWLMPENPDYDPIDGTHAQILGKVVGLIRNY